MRFFPNRREFLGGLGVGGAALVADSWLPSFGFAQTAGPARAFVNKARSVSDLDRRLLGSFLEHLGRAVYTGVYDVPYLDVAVTVDEAAGRASVFVLNRDLRGERELVLDWEDPEPKRVLGCQTLTGDDLKAVNTFKEPSRVAPQDLDAPKAGQRMTLKLPPASYTVLSLAT